MTGIKWTDLRTDFKNQLVIYAVLFGFGLFCYLLGAL